VKNPENN